MTRPKEDVESFLSVELIFSPFVTLTIDPHLFPITIASQKILPLVKPFTPLFPPPSPMIVPALNRKYRLYMFSKKVSMPTGSLCAERNVIGSALAADLSLLRRDIKAVAVLAVARLGTPPPALVGSAIANGSGNENHAGGSKGNASGTPWSGAISGGISGRGDGGSSGGGVYGGPRGGVAMVGDRGPGELFSPAGDSALGSSAVPSGAMSPLTLTPALDTLTPAWDTSRGGFRNTRERDREEVVGIGHVSNIGRGAIGALWPVGAEARMDRELEGMADQKTLEGVRQVRPGVVCISGSFIQKAFAEIEVAGLSVSKYCRFVIKSFDPHIPREGSSSASVVFANHVPCTKGKS